MSKYIIEVPIKIPSLANIMEHWTKRHKRHKIFRFAINAHLRDQNVPILLQDRLTNARATLIRIAPRSLDTDNLASAMKPIQDIVADWLIRGLAPGRADGDSRLSFSYSQEKGIPKEYGLRIEIIFEKAQSVCF